VPRIPVSSGLSIDVSEIVERFVTSSGPGGQNVNKVATAVELRFDARGSPSLPDAVKVRLLRLAGARATQDGVVVITAQSHRSQLRNREDALMRLLDLIRAAETAPKRRRVTRPTLGSKQRRLEDKGVRSGVKAMRRRPAED
jgi:ribosome-associated protein